MFKRIIAVLIILFLVLFSFGCGDSTSSSNIAPDVSFSQDFDSAVNDLDSEALSSNLDSEFYGDIFNEDGGFFSILTNYFGLYTEFRNNAEYNSEEERWEASLEGGEVLIYGEFIDGAFVVTAPGMDLTIYFYPNEESITFEVQGVPDSTEPTIRAELYKSGGYYYGFILEQRSTTRAYMIKFKYLISNPTDEFDLYYGSYVPIAARPLESRLSNRDPIEFEIDEFDFIRDRTELPDIWFSDTTYINEYVYLYFDGGIFGYDTFVY